MRTIFLVGFMGAGKSAVGRELAVHLGRGFVDLDERLADRFGMPITEVFASRGEAAFRAAESEELARVAAAESVVVATGGGAFCSEANRDLIEREGGVSVFLDLPWEMLAARLASGGDGRPLYAGAEEARELWRSRLADYRRAVVAVALDGSEPPGEAAARVAAAVGEAACAT